jgi:uncharacterized membrane protein YcaP (DUF421 family)
MDWLLTDENNIWQIALNAFVVYLAVMIIVRINGLRTFSKMSSHDFAITVAIGSIIASSVVSSSIPALNGVLAIAFLILYQAIWSFIRQYFDNTLLENAPLLLMDGEKILHENLKSARVTEGDLMSKLREANCLNLQQVKAVILEPTGDISVLHGSDELDRDRLMKNVRQSSK